MKTLLSFIAVLGVLVTIHELGHYLVARWCGVRILRFSIGFGKPLWVSKPDRHGTEWVIAALPLGGYVKMLDERDAVRPIPPRELPEAFNRQPVGKRMAIVLAGPVANFLLAVALYTGLYVFGVHQPAARLAEPPAGSVAERAGIEGGETVTAIDFGGAHREMRSWPELRWQLLRGLSTGQAITLHLQGSDGRDRQVTLPNDRFTDDNPEGDPLQSLGFEVFADKLVVQEIQPGSPAQLADMRVGDVVIAIDGRQALSSQQLVEGIRGRPGARIRLDLLRDDVPLSVDVVVGSVASDDDGRMMGRIGVQFSQQLDMVELRYGPFEALAQSVKQVWELSVFSLRMIGRLITGEASLKNISGPLSIADYAGKAASIGIEAFIGFMATISISLAVLNLLPIPLLDGGHLLYDCVEFLTGKPVPERWQNLLQRVGALCIAMLTLLALFNDLSRLLRL